MTRKFRGLLAVAAIVVPALAGSSPPSSVMKLPPDLVFHGAKDAPAPVVFSHTLHVPFTDKCTACHPQPFRMLRPARTTLHAEMDAGRSCGICHDGKAAFATADTESCSRCHAEPKS